MTDPYTILRAFVSAYKGDPIADSDLDDEQPRTITVTLGDIRRAQMAIWTQEQRDKERAEAMRNGLLPWEPPFKSFMSDYNG